jgi:hypothetical protein
VSASVFPFVVVVAIRRRWSSLARSDLMRCSLSTMLCAFAVLSGSVPRSWCDWIIAIIARRFFHWSVYSLSIRRRLVATDSGGSLVIGFVFPGLVVSALQDSQSRILEGVQPNIQSLSRII